MPLPPERCWHRLLSVLDPSETPSIIAVFAEHEPSTETAPGRPVRLPTSEESGVPGKGPGDGVEWRLAGFVSACAGQLERSIAVLAYLEKLWVRLRAPAGNPFERLASLTADELGAELQKERGDRAADPMYAVEQSRHAYIASRPDPNPLTDPDDRAVAEERLAAFTASLEGIRRSAEQADRVAFNAAHVIPPGRFKCETCPELADPGRPNCTACREQYDTHLLRDVTRVAGILVALLVFYEILDRAGLLGLFAGLGRWFGQ